LIAIQFDAIQEEINLSGLMSKEKGSPTGEPFVLS
jgi:hypothetical protein